MNKQILTRPKATANHFSISVQTLWRWRKLTNFPQPLERGKVVLYDIKSITEWLTQEAANDEKY